MTVICVKDGVMAADSQSINQGMRHDMPFPKIWRGPKGLLGMSGRIADIWHVGNWWKDGADPDKKPTCIDSTSDDGISCLILRPDGSVWAMGYGLVPSPTEHPATMGISTACYFAEGLMRAGTSADEAVRIAIEHCDHIGGKVQVERLLPESPPLEMHQHITTDPDFDRCLTCGALVKQAP